MRSDIVPGAVFPDFELPDHTDTARRLSTLQGDDPMVLTLNRGIYCPRSSGRRYGGWESQLSLLLSVAAATSRRQLEPQEQATPG